MWIGRNDRELGPDGPFSLSWDFAESGFSSLMLEDGTIVVEEDGTLDVEEDGMEDEGGREEVEEDGREYDEKDVAVESLFVEV